MLSSLYRACYDRRRLVALAWLVVLVAGFTLGSTVFDRLQGGFGAARWESAEGYRQLEAQSPYGQRLSALVDTAPSGRSVDDPAVRTPVTAATAKLSGLDGVARVVDAYGVPAQVAGRLRATDGRATLVSVDLAAGLPEEREEALAEEVERRLRAIEDTARAEVSVSGTTLVNREINEQTERDTRTGEAIALPLTLLVMIVVFGGLAAAGVPFLGALASIAGGLLALLGMSYLLDDLDPSVVSVTTVLGLGLSIDYALLVVSRYREERGAGRDVRAALERTGATAGRTITFSALTVAASLAGLFAFPAPIFRAIASAGVGVVLVALLAGLTLVPALVALLARRISAPTRPVPDDGAFARLARAVQRRAVLVVLAVGGLLLAAGSSFLHVAFQNGGADLLPRELETRRFADLLAERFSGGGVEPVTVVAAAPLPAVERYAAGLGQLTGSGSFPGLATAVRPPEQRGDVVVLEMVPTGESQGEAAQELVRELRAERPDFPTWVTGDAAILLDFQDEIRDRIPLGLGVVALATFTLLFLMTGSLLVPAKALVMNTLSLGATFGALVWVFQDGNLSGLLGFTPTGALETWVPVIAFAFAFGLSMDYEVFLLSRVKELYDAGYDNQTAVVLGLQRSGRIITCAALLMVIVFAGFATGKMLGIKQLGLGLALAVLVDATLVRCLLVPATMTLLGDRNWWAPAPLRRLHDRIGLREAPAEPPAPAPAATLVGPPS